VRETGAEAGRGRPGWSCPPSRSNRRHQTRGRNPNPNPPRPPASRRATKRNSPFTTMGRGVSELVTDGDYRTLDLTPSATTASPAANPPPRPPTSEPPAGGEGRLVQCSRRRQRTGSIVPQRPPHPTRRQCRPTPLHAPRRSHEIPARRDQKNAQIGRTLQPRGGPSSYLPDFTNSRAGTSA